MKLKKFYSFIITALLLLLILPTYAQLTWPEVTSENKPWTRWWWLGNAVDTANLGKLMETYAKSGLGGLEIVPIYGVKGTEDKILPYLGTDWIRMLSFTLEKANELQMGIDMANGTGWPFGGNWVTADNASQHIAFTTLAVNGGGTVTEKLLYSKHYIRKVAAYSTAIDQLRESVQVKPWLVMAYDSSGAALNLTKHVDNNGYLKWTAPSGIWKVIALYTANHGKMVERSAPGAEGYAIDHFSETALTQHLQHFDSALAGISGIRCMFNDSYEVDDAFGQADWTPRLPEEFAKRRGYDLLQYLPALLLNDTSALSRRIIYDYRLTISELLLDQFTQPWHRWANKQGMLTRNQAHGSPANILDLYAASDIPEAEGNDILRFKFASSAGNITGKRLISAEAATWLNDHFISTLADVKQAADKYFLGGVNHLIYHGIAYSPVNDPWPGWLFYAAVHFQPSNPMWTHFPALNSYVARTQSFLQQGKSDNDVLVYFPFADRLSDPGDHLLRHFDGMAKEFRGTGFEECATQLSAQGYTFDFISDNQILQASVHEKFVHTQGAAYQTIIVPDCRYMPFETWKHLFELAEAGATVLFYKSSPAEVPGFKDYHTFQSGFDTLKQSLHFINDSLSSIQKADWGEGRFMQSQDLRTMLEYAGIRRESLTDLQLPFVRRKIGNNTLYLIKSNAQTEFTGWINLQCQATSARLFDAYTGLYGKAAIRQPNDKSLEVFVTLKPSASLLVMAYSEEITGESYPYYHASDISRTIGDDWTVDFISGGPIIPPPVSISKLISWTEWGKDLESFSGVVQYTTTFRKPAKKATHYLLNLGKVHDCADVKINGIPVATLIGEDFSTIIDASVLKKKNLLEIRVSNRMANRIIGMDQQGLMYKKFHNVNFPAFKRENVGPDGLFSAASWQPFPSGLLGPVTITPMEQILTVGNH